MGVPYNLFALSDLLGLHNQFAAAVLKGRFYRLHRGRVGRDALEFAALFGSRRPVEASGRVSEMFSSRLIMGL